MYYEINQTIINQAFFFVSTIFTQLPVANNLNSSSVIVSFPLKYHLTRFQNSPSWNLNPLLSIRFLNSATSTCSVFECLILQKSRSRNMSYYYSSVNSMVFSVSKVRISSQNSFSLILSPSVAQRFKFRTSESQKRYSACSSYSFRIGLCNRFFTNVATPSTGTQLSFPKWKSRVLKIYNRKNERLEK